MRPTMSCIYHKKHFMVYTGHSWKGKGVGITDILGIFIVYVCLFDTELTLRVEEDLGADVAIPESFGNFLLLW